MSTPHPRQTQFQTTSSLYYANLHNYLNLHVCPSLLRLSSVGVPTHLTILQLDRKMSLIKVAWYVLRVKNIHFGSPSDPSQTAAAEAKLRYVYSILKPHGQSSGSPVRIYYSSISSCPQRRSQAVVCASTPRKCPHSGYFLV